MHFSKLRLTGFKSFVDPTELWIEPGLTGIVGPNGCGKSNLLEAIRWVMGENRAKSMRGSGMSDVIFAGTNHRPPRHMAEVSLILENSDGTAPTPYDNEETIEVTRRIERDSGSAYRVNGRDVRQKDIQLLFADAATGAHSPALVSQGRIGALISAKPQDRRAILEEAAGISGLYSRRHDAELRLRAAENNLVRLQDVLRALEGQLGHLSRQARQAGRYKDLAENIEKLEAQLSYLHWDEAATAVIGQQRALTGVQQSIAVVLSSVREATQKQTDMAEAVAIARSQDQKAATTLHDVTMAARDKERETQEAQRRMGELSQRLEELRSDLHRDTHFVSDAEGVIERLKCERESIEVKSSEFREQITALEARLPDAETQVKVTDSEYEDLRSLYLQKQSDRRMTEDKITDLRKKCDRNRIHLEGLETEKQALLSTLHQRAGAKENQEKVDALLAALEPQKAKIKSIKQELETRRQEKYQAVTERTEAAVRLKGVTTELSHLENMLARRQSTDGESLLPQIRVIPGYEVAFAAVFLGMLDVDCDLDHGRHWFDRKKLDVPKWPLSVTLMTDVVSECPSSLRNRLLFTAILHDGENGDDWIKRLSPGQMLVDRKGTIWRWDGYRRPYDEATGEARWIERQNRLVFLTHETARASLHCDEAGVVLERVTEQVHHLEQSMADAEVEFRRMEQAWSQARDDFAQQREERRRLEGQIELKTAGILEREGDLKSLNEELGILTSSLPDPSDYEQIKVNLAEAKEALHVASKKRADLLSEKARLVQDLDHNGKQTGRVQREIEDWQARIADAVKKKSDLLSREEDTKALLESIREHLKQNQLQDGVVQEGLLAAQSHRQNTAQVLNLAEDQLAEANQKLKEAEKVHQMRREEAVRIEALHEAVLARRKEIAREIGDKFGCDPTALLNRYGDLDAKNDDLDHLEARLLALKGERERLGPVNLRADEELCEIREQVDHMRSEKEDLEAAIKRLRQAIGSLNREGRERLLAAFEQVNAHFTTLFETLFGGGQAYLALTESDDPLEAGLEIYASPPGKKVQALSLLSGGEQALTATSLIFAVFMTNPAPICVLDEVDAPLDDANVERFCNLLDDMVARTDTRFMIVTHNAVTMSRMGRLFGVTMSERGVSTLVSVDLSLAAQMTEAV